MPAQKKPKPKYCVYNGKKYPIGTCLQVGATTYLCEDDGHFYSVPGPCPKKTKAKAKSKVKRKTKLK